MTGLVAFIHSGNVEMTVDDLLRGIGGWVDDSAELTVPVKLDREEDDILADIHYRYILVRQNLPAFHREEWIRVPPSLLTRGYLHPSNAYNAERRD